MKETIFLIIFIFKINILIAQISICSWNLKDLGKSKTEITLNFIATTVKDFDVIAIQEVSTGNGGAQAVARLADELNRKGTKWDYTISNPTSSSAYKTERYAFIWKTNKLTKVGRAWLEVRYTFEIDREPFFITFKSSGKEFTIATFHAITKSMQPETEIKYFKFFPAEYPDKNLIFTGDFNCPQSHTVFNPLKTMGYKPVLINQKTSLRQVCINNDCLASEFDNIFYGSKITYIKSGVIHFYRDFVTLNEARFVSDHVPIYFYFSLN